MALVHRLFLPLLILLMVPHPGAAKYASQKSQEAADSLADSLAAWKKDGLEPLGKPGAYVKADGSLKSSVVKEMRNPSVLPKSGEKQNEKAAGSPQADSEQSAKAGGTTKQVPNARENTESIFCHGAGCMTGIVIVLVTVPAGILLCSLGVCWWCEKKRRLSGDQQERTGLIACSDSQNGSPEPGLPLQQS